MTARTVLVGGYSAAVFIIIPTFDVPTWDLFIEPKLYGLERRGL